MTGTWVGPGSAARNSAARKTRRTSRSRRESIFSGRFRSDNDILAAHVLLRLGLVYRSSGSELVRKKI